MTSRIALAFIFSAVLLSAAKPQPATQEAVLVDYRQQRVTQATTAGDRLAHDMADAVVGGRRTQADAVKNCTETFYRIRSGGYQYDALHTKCLWSEAPAPTAIVPQTLTISLDRVRNRLAIWAQAGKKIKAVWMPIIRTEKISP